MAWKTKVGVLNVRLDGSKAYEYVKKEEQRIEDGEIWVENAKGTFIFIEGVKQKETSPDYTIYKEEG